VKTRKENAGEPSDLEMGICFQTSFAPSIIIFALSTLSKLEIFIKHLLRDKYIITIKKSIRSDGLNKPGACHGKVDERCPVDKFSRHEFPLTVNLS
jgi:hypothetical protein